MIIILISCHQSLIRGSSGFEEQNNRQRSDLQTERESELLEREEQLERKESEVEQILRRLKIQEQRLNDSVETRNREISKELELLKQKQQELTDKEEKIRRRSQTLKIELSVLRTKANKG